MLSTAPICVAPTADFCGEGAVWSAAGQCVYWTDINRFLIHRYTPRHGCVKTWLFDEPVTALALTLNDETLAVVLGSRLILWSPKSDWRRDFSFRLKGWPKVRCNDARADPAGSLWIGSMGNNVNADGSPGEVEGQQGILYRVDPDGSVSEWKDNIGISNTLVWNRESTRFYFGDTRANAVYRYDYNAQTRGISGEQTFFSGFMRGYPDGSGIDAEGYLWNCRWGGGCVVRVAPDGSIDRVLEMPVKNVTTCTFGGPDLRTLYITTAAAGAEPGQRFAGGLFALETDVPGSPENRFAVR